MSPSVINTPFNSNSQWEKKLLQRIRNITLGSLLLFLELKLCYVMLDSLIMLSRHCSSPQNKTFLIDNLLKFKSP